MTATGTGLKWYSSSTGGTGSATAPLPTTSATGTTNYYVSQSANGCESSRTLIAVTVNAIPASPGIVSPVNYCQNATATALTATGTVLKWYTSLTGGTGSTSAPVPTTSTTGNINYYVSQTVTNCESSRATIVVNVNTPPAAPLVSSPVNYCQNASASPLTASGTSLKWYTVSSGGTAATSAPTPSTGTAGTTNFYVSQSTAGCESARATIAVTITSSPLPGVVTPVTYCQNEPSVPLTATGTSLKWYTSTGGTGSTTAPVPSTSTVGTSNYFVSQTTNGCESARATIAVAVNAIPASPVVNSPVNYCQNSSATALTANGTALKWYTSSSGGVSSSTAPVPVTTSAGTTNYYVSQTFGGCESPRAVIAVTVTAYPVATISAATSTTFCQGSSVTLAASSGTSFVWHNGSTQVGTNSTYTALISGSYTVDVTNSSGCKATSSPLVVTVNPLPAATITPGGPTTFREGGSVLLSANSGTGYTYKWFRGLSLVGTGTNYTATTSGSYEVEVTNPAGCKSTSSVVTVTVNPNQPPSVEITNPLQNASFVSPANVSLAATATDVDGTIAHVEFYIGSTLLVTDVSSPYNYSFNNLSPGSYSITAKATDDFGATTTSSVITFTVNNSLPSVSITSPSNGTAYIEYATVPIEASAYDPNGSIALVEFYHGTTLIGSDATEPFSTVWNHVSAGTYQITAKAIDNEGGVGISSDITIIVNGNQPSVITINSPINNSTTTGTSVTIDVTVTDPDGEVILVEYLDGTTVVGTSTTAPFILVLENPSPGTHNISVRVTDSYGGVTVSSPSTVTVSDQTGIHGFAGVEVFSKVYPNPTNTLVYIETYINLVSSSVKFFNSLGEEVLVPFVISGTNATADLSGVSAGVYTLTVSQDKGIIRKKIVVAR
jgi:hypothetical protein